MRGPRTPAPPPKSPRFSLWLWLRGLFSPARPEAPPSRPTPQRASEQESRIIASFGRHYGIEFRNPDLLKLALTHRSYLSVTGQGPRESNERLEFLGDSILGLVTSEFLYREHPTEHEGQLTKTKSLLVSKAILSRRALAMGLGRFVLMSHSEVESGGRQRLSILADAFEAVVGAIYLDQGFEAGRSFITRWLLRETREIVADKRHTNFKSHLQEFVQSTYRTHPVYRIRSEIGPDHSKQFNVEVMVGKRVLGTGKGRNKKEAEQAAARNALEQVEGTKDERKEAREPREVREPRESRSSRAAREPETRVGAGSAVADEVREVREPRESRGPREPREVRETREPREARAPLVTPRIETDEDAEGDDDAGDRKRRRRGRRGGRGRRREGPAGEIASRPAEPARIETPEPRSSERTSAPRSSERTSAPRSSERTSPPRSGERFHAPARADVSPVQQASPVEHSSVDDYESPPARRDPYHFEEDFEEVGRPEGPLEERHVDPYGFEESQASVRTEPAEEVVLTRPEPADEPMRVHEPVHEDEPEPRMAETEFDSTPSSPSSDEDDDAPSDRGMFNPPDQDEEARPERSPQYGRRSGRSRRSR